MPLRKPEQVALGESQPLVTTGELSSRADADSEGVQPITSRQQQLAEDQLWEDAVAGLICTD